MLDALVSAFYGALLLIVALLFLPDRITAWIMKKIRPDLTSKEALMVRLRTSFDYIFNPKAVIVSNRDSRNEEEAIKSLVDEKRTLESNLFFLDLLQNLAAMLYFSVGPA